MGFGSAARGRHVRRTGLAARLWWPRRRRSRVARLQQDVHRLRLLNAAAADAAGAALQRAVAATDTALAAEQRAVLAEAALAGARDEVAGLRADLAALREELVWAFAARRADAVIDLTGDAAQTA
jgi:hypothetical protein